MCVRIVELVHQAEHMTDFVQIVLRKAGAVFRSIESKIYRGLFSVCQRKRIISDHRPGVWQRKGDADVGVSLVCVTYVKVCGVKPHVEGRTVRRCVSDFWMVRTRVAYAAPKLLWTGLLDFDQTGLFVRLKRARAHLGYDQYGSLLILADFTEQLARLVHGGREIKLSLSARVIQLLYLAFDVSSSRCASCIRCTVTSSLMPNRYVPTTTKTPRTAAANFANLIRPSSTM